MDHGQNREEAKNVNSAKKPKCWWNIVRNVSYTF